MDQKLANQMAPVKTVSTYLEQVSRIKKLWNFKLAEELWFRGEERDFGTTALVPKVYRPNHPTDFLLEIENRIIPNFQRCSGHLSDDGDLERFDAYMQMQHHGAPTRLLDWSDGALIALHFAVKRTREDSHPRFVYLLDPTWLNDESHPEPEPAQDADDDALLDLYLPDSANKFGAIPEKPLVLEFHQTSRRMGAQRSHFVLCGRDRKWLRSNINQHGSRLTTIVIEDAPIVREELRTCGITESVIYPDLDGLGREMSDLWSDLLTAS